MKYLEENMLSKPKVKTVDCGPVLQIIKRRSPFLFQLWVSCYNNNSQTSIFRYKIDLSFFLLSYLSDFQTPTLPYQYTSENSPFLVPFSIPPNIQWDYIKNVTQKIEWFFTPKTSSVATKLFSLSMKEPFKPEVGQGRNLKHFNFNKGDFSLGRNKGQKDDAGTYTCSITFNDEKTRKSTRKFEVLQSKSLRSFFKKRPNFFLTYQLSK